MIRLFASVLTLVTLAAARPVSPAAPKMLAQDSTRIGVQLWTFRVFSFEKALRKVDSAGIRYIEAFPGQPLGAGMKDSFGIRMSPGSLKQVQAMLRVHKIKMVAFGVIVPQSIAEWDAYFRLGKTLGVEYITAEPLKDQIASVDSLAGIYGIPVAIHDHPRPSPYWHPDSVLAVIKGLNNIGACADLGHWARNGLDPVECLKMLDGKVYGGHLKDIAKPWTPQSPDTLVGKGSLDYKAILAELHRQQFKGVLSIEHESNWENNLPEVTATRKYITELEQQ